MTASTAPAAATARVQPKLHLVPWDASSDAHVRRMESQRDGCGWDTAAVPNWAGKVLKGNKFMYWLVRCSNFNFSLPMMYSHADVGRSSTMTSRTTLSPSTSSSTRRCA